MWSLFICVIHVIVDTNKQSKAMGRRFTFASRFIDVSLSEYQARSMKICS